MTILNLMLGKGRGGLEQASLDYAEALAAASIPSHSVLSPGAWAAEAFAHTGLPIHLLANHGRLDLLAPGRLRRLAARLQATAILCHGNRALSLALRAYGPSPTARARRHHPAILAVAHNASTRRFHHLDACFAITQHAAEGLRAAAVPHVHWMPNMVRPAPARTATDFRSPPVLGSMGRFVEKKGFADWLAALALLKQQGIAFRALLGGDGDEAPHLQQLIETYNLTAEVERIGWVADKQAFFAALDLFILPSRIEPFGIVLLEAMAHGVPVISTDADGPREILSEPGLGTLVPKTNPTALANAMATALAQPDATLAAAHRAMPHVIAQYGVAAMAARLRDALAGYR